MREPPKSRILWLDWRQVWEYVQLYMASLDDVNNQKIVPTLMFSPIHQGKCEEAIAFYESLISGF